LGFSKLAGVEYSESAGRLTKAVNMLC